MTVAQKHFDEDWLPVANTIARMDVPQEVREELAREMTESLKGRKWFMADQFELLASDPLVKCAGPGEDEPCPDDREIRIRMHLSSAPNGRSEAWRRYKPEVRCIDCGSMYFTGVDTRGGR